MAQRGPAIPEEQLLNLIRNPKTKDLNQKQARQHVFRFFSLSALKARLLFLSEKIKRIAGGKERLPAFGIRGLNGILKIAIAGLTVVWGITLVFSALSLDKIPEFTTDASRTSIVAPDDMLSVRKVSYYVEKAKARDIFKFGTDARQAAETLVPQEDEASPPAEPNSILDDLALVGIGFSDDPDVMIKNGKTGKIYFLKRGDWIESEVKVEAIFSDKVILSSDGREIELH